MPIVRDILRLIFPDLCYHCGEPLVGDEQNLCTLCLSKIAWTHNALHPDNDTEIRLTGRIPVATAASLLQFNKGNVTQSIVHQIKYHGNTQLAHQFGLLLGEELKASHRFDDIDIVAPVPLHWWRRMRRGYNQSQLIAEGMSTRPTDEAVAAGISGTAVCMNAATIADYGKAKSLAAIKTIPEASQFGTEATVAENEGYVLEVHGAARYTEYYGAYGLKDPAKTYIRMCVLEQTSAGVYSVKYSVPFVVE